MKKHVNRIINSHRRKTFSHKRKKKKRKKNDRIERNE